eukprot:gene3510-4787_t
MVRSHGKVLALTGPGGNQVSVDQRGTAQKPSRIPVRTLALATLLTCLTAQILSQLDGAPSTPGGGPWGVVLGQSMWNAAQVGLLLVLLCLWCVRRRVWVAVAGVATLAGAPFSIYAVSPGAWGFTVILLATCALALTREVPDLGVSIVDAPAGDTRVLAKFEFLALACNLFCSMYNFVNTDGVWPLPWAGIFQSISAFTGFTPDLPTIARSLYAFGLEGVSLPSYIKVGRPVNNLGALIFSLIWTVLPFLYVVYFAAMAKMAKNTPGTRLQQ